jgi:outer membrane protein
VKRQCMAGLVVLVLGGRASADDLKTIIRDALANNAQYQSVQAQYAAVRERVQQGWSQLLPALALSANSTWNDNRNNVLGLQQYNSNAWTVTLTQPLWHQPNVIALDEAYSQRDEAMAQLEQARQELVIRTAQAYFDVLYAQDALASFRAQRSANLEQQQQAQRGYELGTAAITDVRDAKARYDLVTAQEISAVNDVAAKTNVLRQIIDRDPGPLVPLASGVVLKSPDPESLAPWEQAAQKDNPAVIAGESAVATASLEVRKTGAARLPSVDLVATRGYNSSASTITVGEQNRGNTIGIQVTVPIDVTGGTSAKVREAIDLWRKARADLDEARRNGLLSAQQAYLGATSGIAQVKALEEALESARVALQANRRGQEVGIRINIDVLNAQQQFAATERDLAKARYDTLMSLLRLKGAAGSLDASDVEQINSLLAR